AASTSTPRPPPRPPRPSRRRARSSGGPLPSAGRGRRAAARRTRAGPVPSVLRGRMGARSGYAGNVPHNDSNPPRSTLRKSTARAIAGMAAGVVFGAASAGLALSKARRAPQRLRVNAVSADRRPWAAAIDLLRTGVCLVDDSNRVLYANAAAAGRSEERRVGTQP